MKIKLPNEIKTERLTLKKHCLFLNKNGRLASEYVQLWVDSINQNRKWLSQFLTHFDKPMTFEKEEAFLKELVQGDKEKAYAIWHKKTGKLIGSIGAFDFDEKAGKIKAEMGLLLFEKFAGQGFGPEATKAFEKVLFDAGLDEIILAIDKNNTRSRRAAEKGNHFWNGKETIFDKNRNTQMLVYRKTRGNPHD